MLCGLCVQAGFSGFGVADWCQPLGTQEVVMNHGRQIKRVMRAHHILLKRLEMTSGKVSFIHTQSSLGFLAITLFPMSISALTLLPCLHFTDSGLAQGKSLLMWSKASY